MGRTTALIKYQTISYEGNKYRIAKLKKGVDIGNPEKLKIAELICLMYETDDCSLAECSKAVGISERTFFNWRDSISEITDLYISADKKRDTYYRYKLKQRGRRNAERLLDGYTVELKEWVESPVIDAKGKTIMTVASMKIKEVFIKPSVKLTETVLYNVDARVFERNPVPVEKINKDVDIPPISWVD